MVEHRNKDGGTVKKRDGKTVELIWNSDGGTEKQLWWNRTTETVDQWNNNGGTVEQIWWKRRTIIVEQ